MPRYKLTIEYEGTSFNGWQIQKNQPTIQGKLIEACKEAFKTHEIELIGAGRTDSGVHAIAQIAHLEVKNNAAPGQIKIMLNDLLPAGINIVRVEKTHPKFHARYDAIARSYVYHISTRRTAFGKRLVWWIKDKLDLEKMLEIGELFEGFKDFKSFGETEKEDASTKVEIKSVSIHQIDDAVLIHIIGSHFLGKMIRRMVGVMVEAGRNNMTKEQVHSFFNSKSNEPAQFTAPPSGLYLERVYYENDEIIYEPTYILNVFSDEII